LTATARSLERELQELLDIERELEERRYVRRADALERAADAVRRLGEVASAEALPARAARELGTSSAFAQVVISELDGGRLTPVAIWSREQPAASAGGADPLLEQLRAEPVVLEYPLLEYEVARDRLARIVDVAGAGARTPRPLARLLGWSAYVVAPLVAGADTIGLLHADGGHGAEPDAVDLEVVARYADGVSGALERAVLRHTLALHRAELSSAVRWMAARVERLGELGGGTGGPAAVPEALRGRMLDALTPREHEVLRLLARGLTNLQVANALVVREGTVKYHVKNILRKLGATSRADAVSRFVRASAEANPI
jgi:LuxR family transcriptional regulator, regulator of acetate metabolism